MPNAIALPAEVTELVLTLKRRGLGGVIDSTRLTRALYSSDASLYRVVPQAVARPRTVDDLLSVLDAARAVGLPVTTRGAGTSCAGNAVGPGLIIDTVRHLNRITHDRPGGADRAGRAGRRPIQPAGRRGSVRTALRA